MEKKVVVFPAAAAREKAPDSTSQQQDIPVDTAYRVKLCETTDTLEPAPQQKTFLHALAEQRQAGKYVTREIQQRLAILQKELQAIGNKKNNPIKRRMAEIRALGAVGECCGVIAKAFAMIEDEEFQTHMEVMKRYQRFVLMGNEEIQQEMEARFNNATETMSIAAKQSMALTAEAIRIEHRSRSLIYALCESNAFGAAHEGDPVEQRFDANWDRYINELIPRIYEDRLGILTTRGPMGEIQLVGGMKRHLFGYDHPGPIQNQDSDTTGIT